MKLPRGITKRIQLGVKSYGAAGLITAMRRQLLGSRLKCYRELKKLLEGKSGLEIGGPSELFAKRGILPLYQIVHALDNCNYAGSTVWEGRIREGATFIFDSIKPPGRQFLAEITNLEPFGGECYDFVLSSHTLEHTANPVRALSEISRVLKPDGMLVLILPHKERTFDHRRQPTALDHMIADYKMGTQETDLSHLSEILTLHDLSMDPGAGNFDHFKARCQENAKSRCLHHHTFTTRSALELIDWCGMQIVAVEPTLPHHIVVIAMKPTRVIRDQNSIFLSNEASWQRESPFILDRR